MWRVFAVLCLLVLSGCATNNLPNAPFAAGQRFYYDELNYLNYRQVGEGDKALLLFHGYGSSGYNWDDLLPLLDLSEYRVFVFDLKGAGFSSRPLNQDYSVVANAQIINQFIRDYQIKNYVMMGHSFGGGVVLVSTLLSQAGGSAMPRGLVLIDSLSYKTRPPFFVTMARLPFVSRPAMGVISPKLMAKVSLMRSFHNNEKIREDQLLRYEYFLAQHDFADAISQTARDIVPPEAEMLAEAYASIETPALIVWGAEDDVLSLALGKRLVSKMQSAELYRIPDCGHNAQEECPEEFSGAVNEFLRR